MALEQRQQAIASCIKWVDGLGRHNEAYTHILPLHRISFETSSSSSDAPSSSYRPPMVGVFAKQAIKQGDILLTISQDCVVGESHPLLQDLATQVVDKALTVYREKARASSASRSSPWDPFSKSKGRVFYEDELRLALHFTLLFYMHQEKKSPSPKLPPREEEVIFEIGNDGAFDLSAAPEEKESKDTQPKEKLSGKSALHKAANHFAHYLDTLPDNYDSLIFHWTPEEMENLKGTSCHALAERLRTEVGDNWTDSFQDVLMEYLQNQLAGFEIDGDQLHQCYERAICTIYSRMHALDTLASGAVTSKTNTRCTCPLIDLINGDREDSPRCNTHLLEFPGTHVALQATRNIQAGEELLFSYGQVSNQIFITKFGFLPLNNKQGNPQLSALDVVHVLPPPQFIWDEADPRWQALTSARDGKSLERSHLIASAGVSAQMGTPFALMGDKSAMGKVRASETYRPHYLENFHLFAMLFLTDPEVDPEEQIIEPWEPGAIIMEMLDHRLADLPAACMKEDQAMLAEQKGNFRTGTLYRMLERELLQLWRHAVAKQYDVYGEKNSKGVKFQPLADDDGKPCAVCQAVLAGPLKACTQCRAVSYCTRTCQKEDWRGGHREACRPAGAK